MADQSPQLAQIALCTSDIPRSVQLYTEVFGFAEAGGRTLWGREVAAVQATGDDAAFIVWWLVGRQDLFQLEFFHHTTPPQRPLAQDWSPGDLGWVRWGFTVPDFEDALGRLHLHGIPTITPPVEVDGLRRVCFRDPWVGCVVEVMEEGAATPGGVRPRFYDLAPAGVYAAVSVPDLEEARRFFCDTLGMIEQEVQLHTPDLEDLWGLKGARRESFVARSGDMYLEVVRYDDPVGRAKPADHRLSDQGFMNVALGFRRHDDLAAVHARVVGAGYRDNFRLPTFLGGTYVNDAQGNSLELLVAPRELDDAFGFRPRPRLFRRLSWPRTSVPPAGA